MKTMSSLVGLILVSTNLFARDDGSAAVLTGLIGFVALIWISVAVVMVFFILTQNKLIDAIALNNHEMNTAKVWTWTQLIPIWTYVAQAVTIVKLTEQYKHFLNENKIEVYNVSEYKPLWGWLGLGFGAISMVAPFFGMVAFVFLILYWINIHNATISIKRNILVESTL